MCRLGRYSRDLIIYHLAEQRIIYSEKNNRTKKTDFISVIVRYESSLSR